MTDRRFWLEPYRCVLDTRVATVEGEAVTLVASVFYAQSGGQESDRGTIGGLPVLEARIAEADIVYTLPPDHPLKPGDAVQVQIDWPRRYCLMRLHFAAELVLELAYRHLGAVEKIGAHIAEDKARIDFAWHENLARHFPRWESEVQALIDADLPIVSAFSNEAAGLRYWEVDGFARVACGGTHLRRTGEVGAIALKRKNVGRGKERVEITLT
jgi:alanyl-tRNA synthetase